MASITFEGVSRHFAGDVHAVRDFSLSIDDGEFMVVVGPSGSGKTTVLRLLAGLDQPDDGTIRIAGEDVGRKPAKDRNLAMVFQSYALLPHLSARGNIGFGLAIRGLPAREIRQRCEDVARILRIEQLLDRKPAQLSGGERQRVALGRAMVRKGQAVLMDEPLSNLDAELRAHMRAELRRLHQTMRTTTLYVTHDQVEAMTLGDRVAVMRAGRLEQVAAPEELYAEPANTFVARFIGIPAMNIVPGRWFFGGNICEIEVGALRLPMAPTTVGRLRRTPEQGEAVLVGLRPEDLVAEPLEGRSVPWDVRIDLAQVLGREVEISFVPCGKVLSPIPSDATKAGPMPAAPATLIAKTPLSPTPKSGEVVTLHARVDRVTLFDVGSQQNLLRKHD